MEKLFVYGTLKVGQPNTWILGPTEHIAAETERGFQLYQLGELPTLIRGGNQRVKGEVVMVEWEKLTQLDRFEGHPTLYRREKIRLQGGEKVWAYLWRGKKGVLVESGTW